MTPKLEDRVVYFIHISIRTLEKAEKDNFGGFLYETASRLQVSEISEDDHEREWRLEVRGF